MDSTTGRSTESGRRNWKRCRQDGKWLEENAMWCSRRGNRWQKVEEGTQVFREERIWGCWQEGWRWGGLKAILKEDRQVRRDWHCWRVVSPL